MVPGYGTGSCVSCIIVADNESIHRIRVGLVGHLLGEAVDFCLDACFVRMFDSGSFHRFEA